MGSETLGDEVLEMVYMALVTKLERDGTASLKTLEGTWDIWKIGDEYGGALRKTPTPQEADAPEDF